MTKSVSVFLIGLFFVSALPAAELTALRQTYDKQMGGIAVEHSVQIRKLDGAYARSVSAAADRAANAGALDRAKEMTTEAERFALAKSIAVDGVDGGCEALQKMQRSYLKSTDGLVAARAKKIIALVSQYDAALGRLQANLTQQKKFDAATAVQNERKAVAKSAAVVSAKARLTAAAQPAPPPKPKKQSLFASTFEKITAEPEDLDKQSDGAWKTGLKTMRFQQDVDRAFVIDQAWVEGRVLQIDDKAIVMDVMGRKRVFARKNISLIELSDWLDPDLRDDASKDVRVTFRLEGDSEVVSLFFTKGTIIKEVHKKPTFIKGDDQDDKAAAEITRIWFDKGSKDRSVTILEADVTLALGDPDELSFEIYNNRANGSAGNVTLKILESETGKPIAEFKAPIREMWCMSSIPTAKLRPARSALKLKRLQISDVRLGSVQSEGPPKARTGAAKPARVVLANGEILMGSLAGVNEDYVYVQLKAIGDPSAILRSDVSLIELYDWEQAWEAPQPQPDGIVTETVPIRVLFAGSSSEGNVSLHSGDVLARVISPPHFIYGRDFNDMGFISSERVFGFNKHALDRSLMQVEAIVTLNIEKKPSLRFAYANRYTNILAGDVKVFFIDAMSGRTYWSSSSTLQKSQKSECAIQRSRLLR